MIKLSELANTHRPAKKIKRVGRGVGSKRGKTCGRGVKGDKSRRGYQNRFGQEGGQIPLYKKLPTRGFSNARFRIATFAVNLGFLDKFYKDGEAITLETMQEKGLAPRRVPGGLKILSRGELTKKVTIEAAAFSEAAREKLEQGKIAYKVISLKATS
jgi:large subunit ribosomal protein L15